MQCWIVRETRQLASMLLLVRLQAFVHRTSRSESRCRFRCRRCWNRMPLLRRRCSYNLPRNHQSQSCDCNCPCFAWELPHKTENVFALSCCIHHLDELTGLKCLKGRNNCPNQSRVVKMSATNQNSKRPPEPLVVLLLSTASRRCSCCAAVRRAKKNLLRSQQCYKSRSYCCLGICVLLRKCM